MLFPLNTCILFTLSQSVHIVVHILLLLENHIVIFGEYPLASRGQLYLKHTGEMHRGGKFCIIFTLLFCKFASEFLTWKVWALCLSAGILPQILSPCYISLVFVCLFVVSFTSCEKLKNKINRETLAKWNKLLCECIRGVRFLKRLSKAEKASSETGPARASKACVLVWAQHAVASVKMPLISCC